MLDLSLNGVAKQRLIYYESILVQYSTVWQNERVARSLDGHLMANRAYMCLTPPNMRIQRG